jgi:hypothetical protein
LIDKLPFCFLCAFSIDAFVDAYRSCFPSATSSSLHAPFHRRFFLFRWFGNEEVAGAYSFADLDNEGRESLARGQPFNTSNHIWPTASFPERIETSPNALLG